MNFLPHTLSATERKLTAAIMVQHASCRSPLYDAVAAQLMALHEYPRGGQVLKRDLKTLRDPAVVLIGDDDGEATGPTGWSGIRHAKRWAVSAIIHAAAGEAAHYQAAVIAAGTHKRLLLVETTAEHRDAWISALAPLPYFVISPPDAATASEPAGRGCLPGRRSSGDLGTENSPRRIV